MIEELEAQLVEAAGTDWVLLGQVFGIIFVALLVDFIQKRVLKRVGERAPRAGRAWDRPLVNAARRPLSAFIWLTGVTLAAQLVGRQTDAVIFEAVPAIRSIGTISVVTWFLIGFINAVERDFLAREEGEPGMPVDRTTAEALSKLAKIAVMIAAGLVVLESLGVSISGLVAFGGMGGLVAGFAAKDLLANVFGGMMIYMDRPFVVGEWIRSPDQEIEGTVERIGWRLTCIRTFDKRPLYVPNATFASISVQNPSRMSHRRLYETVGIRYQDVDKMAAITAEVRQMLTDHPEVDETQTLMVNFNEFAASSLNFFIYAFTHTVVWAEFHAVKEEVLLKIADIIARHGAEIAFPTSTVHVPEPMELLQGEGRAARGPGEGQREAASAEQTGTLKPRTGYDGSGPDVGGGT
ncbi:MAG TPA: mechanosensitive ion channel family protein [Gammaproteobacteria bacterium]|nr:mechanosensitive ion channel family protein [Gammaproteobacteria bacterium]